VITNTLYRNIPTTQTIYELEKLKNSIRQFRSKLNLTEQADILCCCKIAIHIQWRQNQAYTHVQTSFVKQSQSTNNKKAPTQNSKANATYTLTNA